MWRLSHGNETKMHSGSTRVTQLRVDGEVEGFVDRAHRLEDNLDGHVQHLSSACEHHEAFVVSEGGIYDRNAIWLATISSGANVPKREVSLAKSEHDAVGKQGVTD